MRGTPQDVLGIDRRCLEDETAGDAPAAHAAASGEVYRALPTVLGLELQAHERLVVDGGMPAAAVVRNGARAAQHGGACGYVVQHTEADVEAALIPRRGGLPLEDRHRLMNRRIFQYGAWLADEARARSAGRRGAPVRVPAGSRPGRAGSRTERSDIQAVMAATRRIFPLDEASLSSAGCRGGSRNW